MMTLYLNSRQRSVKLFRSWFAKLSEFGQKIIIFLFSLFCYSLGTVIFLVNLYFYIPSLAFAATTDDSIKAHWGQCDQVSDTGVVHMDSQAFVLTTNGRFLRPKTDFKQSYNFQENTRAFWNSLGITMKKRGVNLYFAPIPPRGLLQDYASSKAWGYSSRNMLLAWRQHVRTWKHMGIQFVDLMPTLHGLGKDAAFARDHHWTPKAAQIAAKRISAVLSDEKALQNIPKQEYLLLEEQQKHLGSFAKNYYRLCGKKPPEESLTFYTAEWQTEDIFAESPEAMIAVTGASNLNPEFGFAANLSHYLSQPVANFGVNGGGFQHGILNLFQEDSDQPFPLWVVWVLPSYHGDIFKFSDIHREILAASQGRCHGHNALVEAQGEVSNEKITWKVTYPESKNTKNEALYFQFHLPKNNAGTLAWPSDKTLSMKIHHGGKTPWKFTFKRKRQGLNVYTVPIPKMFVGQDLTLELMINSKQAPMSYICQSPYLQQWPEGMLLRS